MNLPAAPATLRWPIFFGTLALALAQVTASSAAEPATGAQTPSAAAGSTQQRAALRGEKNLGAFSLFDTDHDGVLSPAEIAAAPEVLRQLDKNHDGSLTADELPRRHPGPPPRDRRPGSSDDGPPSPPAQN